MNRIITLLTLVCGLTLTTSLMAANVAKIGDTEYATIDAAIAAWKTGDVIELLTDIERNSYFVFGQSTFTIDGKGHTIKCTAAHSKYWRYFVNANGSNGTAIQTFKNVTIDANGKVPYVMQSIDGGKLILENVTLKGAKTTTVGSWLSRSTALGYGIHINDGSVEATDLKVSNCEVSDVFLDGNSSSFTLAGDNCNIDVVGSSSRNETVISTAKGYYAYEVTYDGNIKDGVTKTISNKSWNGIIDQVQQAATAIVASYPVTVKINSVAIKLLQDVTLSETFISNDTRLTVDGNGHTITGTIKFTSSPSTLKNFVLGNGSTIIPSSGELTDHKPSSLSLSLADGAFVWSNGKKYCQNGDAFMVPLAQLGEMSYATVEEALTAAPTGSKLQILDAGLVAGNVSALVTTGPAQPSSPSEVAMLLGARTFTLRDSGLLAADGKVLVYEYNLGIRAMTFTPEGFVLTIGLEESGETVTRTFPNRCRWIVVFVGDKKVASRELTKIGDGSPTVVLPQETVLGTTPDGGSLTNRITFKITDEEPESEESTL